MSIDRLHPRVFSDLDVTAEMYDFFAFAYGMSEEQVDAVIIPVLEGVHR